jgi:hypothetical protein
LYSDSEKQRYQIKILTKLTVLTQLKKHLYILWFVCGLSKTKSKDLLLAKKWMFVLFVMFLFLGQKSYGQAPRKGNRLLNTKPQSEIVIGPNTTVDSLRKQLKNDSLATTKADTTKKKKGDIDTTVEYAAKDSTISDPDERILRLYGDARVKYGKIELTADYIEINYKENLIFARGTKDTTRSKKIIGKPIFKQGSERYDSDEIKYNFKTRKAIIKGLITQQSDGFVHGETVKKDDEDNLYIRQAKYTTCNLKNPHFHIAASKIKIVGKKQIVSGPFHLELNDIPLPIGLPFGFFPYQQRKENGTSGILMGNFGEEPLQGGRGFFLRDFGYYWAVNEHLGIQFRTEIYTKGSWGLRASGQYTKKYRYSGNFNLAFTKSIRGDEVNPTTSNDFSIQWSHSPVSYGRSTFSASVNAVTNSYNALNNIDNPTAYIQNTFGSALSYTYNFSDKLRSGFNFRIDQNTSTKVLNTSLDFSLGLAQIQPFKNKKAVSEKFLDGFRVGIDLSSSAQITNQTSATSNPFDFTVSNLLPRDTLFKQQQELQRLGRTNLDVIPLSAETIPVLLRNARVNTRFSVPLSLPNIKLGQHINFTPSMSLQGEIFNRQLTYSYRGVENPDTVRYTRSDGQRANIIQQGVRVDTLTGVFIVPNYSFSGSINTRLYGTLKAKIGRLQAIRHTISPAISASYTPDFSQDPSLFQRDVLVGRDSDGKEIRRTLSRFNPGTYAGPAASMSFSISNQFEAKLKSKNDTAQKEFEKIMLLDNLSLSSGYNFLAPEYKLAPISMAASSLVKQFNISMSATLDPYIYEKQSGFDGGRRVDKYAWQEGKGLGQISNFNLSISRSFKPGANKPQQPKVSDKGSEETLKTINRNINDYIDWNIPWSLQISYNYNFSKFGLSQAQTTSSMTFSGDLSISEKWKISVQSGYDFKFGSFAYTSVNINRDLHCWDMSFSWIPAASPQFGRASSYMFTIRPKSALLSELKLTRRRSFLSTGGF